MDNRETVQVWDILVRIFHWSLVVSFIVAYFTSEEENAWHIYAGYTVLGLIVFRMLWGFVGSRHARFSDFIYSPAKVVQYVKSIRTGNPEHYLGHNPAGGWMVMAMLVTLLVVTVSGLKLYAVEEGKGPLAMNATVLNVINVAHAEDDDDRNEKAETENEAENANEKEGEDEGEDFWEEIHEVSTNLMLLLIGLHLVGVVMSSRVHGENLVKAMFSGKKQRKGLND